ncbi:MAG: aldo/keto reductase [Candidatus Marinimicrobia bacterium]|nr:aldo/keto reductase [Candidatus Neomarinimicrobiota bacterium]MCF7827633.1 aldo/keto reductase [Candidatus Neomarinimicrobiota bacterium]MCF7881312.1 aldo/keto reductase [Candidatus Neomarinimicrobiota bacterium]
MNYRTLGKTGFEVSEISLGTWQVGGGWGAEFDEEVAEEILETAIESGVNFIDTADVYSDGQSEHAVGEFVRSRDERLYVATKCGRQLTPHTNEQYTPEALRRFVEESLRNSGLETLDLIQLHCPPTEVYYRPEIFEEFDKLKDEGKIRNLGVSVEKVEEALKAIEYPNVTTVQIIFNIFRQRPKELFFEQAKEKNVGIIIRVPLASGLLSGKYNKNTTFDEGDHRHFNRDGSAFDRGETFAGLDYELGLEAVEELKKEFPDVSLPQLALKWILMFDAVSTVIPGASKVSQVESNVQASAMEPLTNEQMQTIDDLYKRRVKNQVHHLW